MKVSITDIINKKNNGKITCLTAYTFPIAKIIDNFCDIILVGDSLGMCIYGFEDTVDVNLAMMIDHGKAVVKAAKKSMVVIDIPCNSFEESANQALETAKILMQETGCDAVKIETSKEQIAAIKLISQNNIPIIAHIGLLPQQVRNLGGYKYQGRDQQSAQEIYELALAAQNAGAFALVIEAVPKTLADKITTDLKIPTIGIGASVNCDGQVLVIDDLLGLNQEFKPRFVKNYTNLAQIIADSVKEFKKEVEEKHFPNKENMV